MKKTILLSSVFAVGAAFANVTVTSTELGVMGLAKPTAAAGLIAVPFLGNDGPIEVANMINTAELEAGTLLHVPVVNGESVTYEIWTLGADGKWMAPKTVEVGEDGSTSNGNSASVNTTTIAQGGAFWLELPNGATQGRFYLLGQMGGNGTSTAVAGKWNLIGNTSGSEVSLLNLEGTSNDDRIVVPLENGKLRYYTYKAGKGWRYQTSTGDYSVPAKDPLKVGFGKGIWCYPKNSNLTITWTPVQAQ